MAKGDEKTSARDTRQRILDAAVEIGSRFGYAQATTKAIAEAAGVNEVTLFRHFGTKENLFSEAIEQYGAPALVSEIEEQLSGNYRQDLILIGQVIFSILFERREMLHLLLCESANIPEVRSVLARNPRELRQMLARFFKAQMGKGVVRQGHADLMAQAFLGMFFAYAISLDILDSAVEPPVSKGEFIQGCVDVFVNGTVRGDHLEGAR
jgi:AcrR family transcriptional regulator